MAELITPNVALHAEFADAHADWGPGLHEDGFGIDASDDVDSRAGFAAWVDRITAEERASTATTGCRYRWIVDGDVVLGGIAARWGDSEFIRQCGHIGYGIRPSARGRGHGTWALGEMVEALAGAGLNRVLLVCEDDNAASAATIERNGGRLEEVRATPDVPVRRYWIVRDE